MSRRTITIELASETAELLKARAAARHLSLDEYLHALATGEGPTPETKPAIAPRERVRLWDEWTSGHAVRTQAPVDDSRESIYTREDEAL